ncbi:MAG: hypothetical protein ACON4M_05950 [Crocinitomicaceae bacterium]
MIPRNFEDWKLCIEKDCKIELSEKFCKDRISILTDKSSIETKRFESIYGQLHLENVISWYKKALSQI